MPDRPKACAPCLELNAAAIIGFFRPIAGYLRMKTTLFLLAGLFLASTAQAADLKGNPKTGKTLAYTCTGCHGIAEYKNAYPSYRVPKIAGQHEKYLLAALHGYKKGERNHPTMKAQASSYSDQDIADISAYLSSLKSKK